MPLALLLPSVFILFILSILVKPFFSIFSLCPLLLLRSKMYLFSLYVKAISSLEHQKIVFLRVLRVFVVRPSI